MSFSPDFIERVRESSDILDVVSQYVTLKKRGGNWFGLCPFHSEKTGSFSVNPAKGIFHCFGCGAGGNVISFIMMQEKMRFPDAVEYLARRAGLEIPRTKTGEQKSGREKLFNALRKGQHFFLEQFKNNPVPQEYMENRGFDLNICEKMGLGFAPDSWDAFARTITTGMKDFVTVGLVRQRENGGHYDYFRNRLIFPITDLSARVCAFGGRLLGNESEKAPKYLNSPENPAYIKGGTLYALGQNRDAIRRADFAYIVEGYTDLLRLIAVGVENCCAGLGTAFTAEQARILRRYTDKVVLLYDGDEAGAKAAVRTGRTISSVGITVEIAALPQGDDPDSYLRERGGGGLKELQRLSLLAFQYHRERNIADNPQGREKLARDMLESVAQLPGELKRNLAIEEAAEILKLPVQSLRSELRRLWRRRRNEAESTPREKLTFTLAERPERDLIHLLIVEPEAGEEVLPSLNPELFSNSILRGLFQKMKELWLKKTPDITQVLLDSEEDQQVAGFIAECLELPAPGDSSILIQDYIRMLKKKMLKKKTNFIKHEILHREKSGQDSSALLKELNELKKA